MELITTPFPEPNDAHKMAIELALLLVKIGDTLFQLDRGRCILPYLNRHV